MKYSITLSFKGFLFTGVTFFVNKFFSAGIFAMVFPVVSILLYKYYFQLAFRMLLINDFDFAHIFNYRFSTLLWQVTLSRGHAMMSVHYSRATYPINYLYSG